uniref:SWIRM-assoc_1 domain-containing protein n=1 Tax=Gongylonema pulchrum TaxID=637853 RepID=A0A183D9H0_9BILA
LIESVQTVLKAVKKELQSKIDRLEAVENQRTTILGLLQSVQAAANEAKSLQEKCVKKALDNDEQRISVSSDDDNEMKQSTSVPNSLLDQ